MSVMNVSSQIYNTVGYERLTPNVPYVSLFSNYVLEILYNTSTELCG